MPKSVGGKQEIERGEVWLIGSFEPYDEDLCRDNRVWKEERNNKDQGKKSGEYNEIENANENVIQYKLASRKVRERRKWQMQQR